MKRLNLLWLIVFSIFLVSRQSRVIEPYLLANQTELVVAEGNNDDGDEDGSGDNDDQETALAKSSAPIPPNQKQFSLVGLFFKRVIINNGN